MSVSGDVLCPAHTGQGNCMSQAGPATTQPPPLHSSFTATRPKPQHAGGETSEVWWPCELDLEDRQNWKAGLCRCKDWHARASGDGWQRGGLACGRHSGDEAEGAGRAEKRAQKATLL